MPTLTHSGVTAARRFLINQKEVCGILVRGEEDFIQVGDCFVAATFPLDRAGEHVCRASIWKGELFTNKLEGIANVSSEKQADDWREKFRKWRTGVSRSRDHFTRFMVELELADVWADKPEDRKFDRSTFETGIERGEMFDRAFSWVTVATSREKAEELFLQAAERVFG